MLRTEQRRLSRRRLCVEALETRRVLAGGPLMQNIIDPEDTNFDGHRTPQDALIVINDLNGEGGDDPLAFSADVNGDGVVSPGDALYIINRLNSGAEKSGVPVPTRIHNLEKALAAGNLPHRFSEEVANEILATLKNGGLPELGDRFRNGQMINLKDLAQKLTAGGESEPAPLPTSNTSVSGPKQLEPETEPEPVSIEEPLDLTVALEEEAPVGVDWWNEVVDDLSAFEDGSLDPYVKPWLVDGLRSMRSDSTLSEWVDRERIDHWITSLENDESIPLEILLELQAYRSTLGDLQSQIAQMFASFDIEAIMEYLPNLDILVEATTPEYTQQEYEAENEAALAEWASGDLFRLAF